MNGRYEVFCDYEVLIFYFLLMQKQETSSKREYQSIAILQKLIRIDSKDCNFHFKDDMRNAYFKVSYPQINIDNNSNEALLRQLWYHIYSHYFKKIEHEELRRLSYAKSIFSPLPAPPRPENNQISKFWLEQIQFEKDIHELYDQSYLEDLLNQAEQDPEMELWLKGLLLNSKIIKLSVYMDKEKRKKGKIIFSKLKQNRKQRQLKKVKKVIAKLIKEDNREIDQFIEDLNHLELTHSSEIDNQILQLQKELKKIQKSSVEAIEKVQNSVKDELAYYEKKGHIMFLIGGSKEYHKDNRQDLQSLEYLIRCLQQKQIAQSVSKIISTERSNGEIMFQITYEKAINIESKLICEKELHRINYLRETSLVQFYRTGVKSPYSYICHNYVGFRQLMQNRLNITSKMKDKCILQMMKKGACLASLPEIQHQMSSFNMCHHCKFLYHDYLLFTCKFSSDKQSLPRMNLECLNDPNLNESFSEMPIKSRSSQRFMTRKKNCLTSYAKINDQYVCGRKYCYSCLKDSYSHQNIRQNGLCPFCLGVCACTRCLRNEKIAKFKTMYSNLGGDVMKIQQASQLQQLQIKSQIVSQRGRGRPKKYVTTHISINTTQKKLRRFDDKENYVCSGYLLGKKKSKKTNTSTIWKKNNQSGIDTQEEADLKKKKKSLSHLKKKTYQSSKQRKAIDLS